MQQASEDVVQQVSNTGLHSLGGMQAIGVFCHKALTTRLIGKIERFLVQFKKVRCVAPVLGEELEKFLRFEGAAERSEVESRAEQTEEQPVCDDMTHCHDNDYGEPEEPQRGRGCEERANSTNFSAHQPEEPQEVAGERREDNQDGMHQMRSQRREGFCKEKD